MMAGQIMAASNLMKLRNITQYVEKAATNTLKTNKTKNGIAVAALAGHFDLLNLWLITTQSRRALEACLPWCDLA